MNPIEFLLCVCFLMQMVILFDDKYEVNNQIKINDTLLICDSKDIDCIVKYLYK